MAAPYKNYAQQLYMAGAYAGRKLGAGELRVADRSTRGLFMVVCLLIGGVLQILVNLSVISEEDITSTYDAIGDADYPRLPDSVDMDDSNPDPQAPDLGD